MSLWESLFADRAERMKASDIRDAFKLAERGDIVSFAGGFPSPETFPADQVAEVAREIALIDGDTSLQYGPTEGLYELRRLIARRLSGEGVACTPEQVLITNGSQQALDLVGKVTLNPGDGVIVEQPAYAGGLSALGHYEAEFLGIPLDDDGLQVDRLGRELTVRRGHSNGRSPKGRLKLCYTVPNFQNPSGATISEERREKLVELAGEHDFAILEDNPYGELRFEGNKKRHIKSLDPDGRVLYMGSYSKVFLPGFRLGYVVGPEALIQKLSIAKQGTDLCSNSFGQRLIVECERKGILDAHLKSLVAVYKRKRDLMLQALAEHFPEEVRWTRPEGGFFVWVTLPEGWNAKELLPRAVHEEKVAYVSGGAFFTDGSGANTVRLAYSQARDEDIVEGVQRLGRFFKKALMEDRAKPSMPSVAVGREGQEIHSGGRTRRRT